MRGLDYYLPTMAMLLVQFLYAGNSLVVKTVLLQGMSPRVFIVYRHAFATTVIAPIAYFQGKNSASYSLNLRSFSLIFFTALIGIALSQNLYAEGLSLTSASIASAMANFVPAVTFVMTTCLGMEKVNIRSSRSLAKIVGTMVCVSGAMCIAFLKGPKLLNVKNLPSQSIMASGSESWLLGCLTLFGCCCAWSVWLIVQVPATESHPHHLSFSAWMCFMGTLESAVVALLLEPDLNAWKINSLLELGCALTSGVMGSSAAYFLQAWCISRRGPLFCSMFNPLSTVIVTILAALLLHEQIYIGSLTGAIGVIIGLYVVLWGKAEEVVMKVETVTKSMVNPSEEVKILMKETSKEVHCKTDLKEPLLFAESLLT
ncbi:WAT1-related protein At4g30420-like [Abrus precatorius]|uniref:WAT1-related protein n=1 Tax=Abrus precatorius TaxID=3816 RepID=A0A8B8K2C7_ABRPR|nr:WAT1-related protein At4g30420-like [Abrus precatorius]